MFKGLFLPRLPTKSEAEETQSKAPVPAPCSSGVSSGRREAARRQRSSRPGCHPSPHTARCTPRTAAPPAPRQVPLTAPGWAPSCLWGAARLTNPASACGCCEGTPIRTREVFAPPRWKESFSQLTELSPTILQQKEHKLGKHSCNTYFCYAFMFILFFSRASFPNWVQDPICTGLTSTQRGETFSALKLRTEVQEVLRERAWSSSVGQATNTLPGLGATRQKRLGTRRHGQSLSEPVDS